jgi:precorrin-6B methylase 2
LVVHSGPFAGLRYPGIDAAYRIIPKLLGSYEAELHGVVAEGLRRASRVINVGAAEGYYAVGAACVRPDLQVIAFETSEELRRGCQRMAALNGVSDRVRILGAADRQVLREQPLEGAFVVVDCEGCEAELLADDMVADLAAADLLVETHDFARAGITAQLGRRFEVSHEVLRLSKVPRDRALYPSLNGLDEEDAREALEEERSVGGVPAEQHWLFMRSRARPA